PRYFINSLAKGLSVLQAFGEAGHPLTLSEVAKALGANSTTATRLCYTLTELGFIQKDGQRRYHLTPKILTLGHSYISGLAWQEVAQYYLERLFKEVQETVNLSILEGSEMIYLFRIRKRKYLPFDIQIGTKLPVYCTAMGKVLMALGPSERTKPILKALEFKPLTARTITSLDKFMDELERVRKKGYAINDEELSIGNRSVGAPIMGKQGYAVAAINIAVPTTEYSRSQMEKILAPQVIRTAHEISDALMKMEAPIVMGGLVESKAKNPKFK
ncbi:MAG TPA: IclR family transcriptional regulator C-terminal domain-containing protein, partial [Thermodesulfobacteriota bacterium]|nr:IclR family transcriptional regulator C-terminal domain-containing protein [Thermodesulfobacteriota bacterium]